VNGLGKRGVMGYILKASVRVLLAFCLLMPCAVPEQNDTATTGAVQGTVSIGGHTDPLFVSGARVVLYGEMTISSTESSSEGKFSLSTLRPGIYLIEATYFDLHAEQKITVHPGELVQVSLEFEAVSAQEKH